MASSSSGAGSGAATSQQRVQALILGYLRRHKHRAAARAFEEGTADSLRDYALPGDATLEGILEEHAALSSKAAERQALIATAPTASTRVLVDKIHDLLELVAADQAAGQPGGLFPGGAGPAASGAATPSPGHASRRRKGKEPKPLRLRQQEQDWDLGGANVTILTRHINEELKQGGQASLNDTTLGRIVDATAPAMEVMFSDAMGNVPLMVLDDIVMLPNIRDTTPEPPDGDQQDPPTLSLAPVAGSPTGTPGNNGEAVAAAQLGQPPPQPPSAAAAALQPGQQAGGGAGPGTAPAPGRGHRRGSKAKRRIEPVPVQRPNKRIGIDGTPSADASAAGVRTRAAAQSLGMAPERGEPVSTTALAEETPLLAPSLGSAASGVQQASLGFESLTQLLAAAAPTPAPPQAPEAQQQSDEAAKALLNLSSPAATGPKPVDGPATSSASQGAFTHIMHMHRRPSADVQETPRQLQREPVYEEHEIPPDSTRPLAAVGSSGIRLLTPTAPRQHAKGPGLHEEHEQSDSSVDADLLDDVDVDDVMDTIYDGH